MSQYGRNELCPCRSGKKYKKCCISKERNGSDTPITSLREAAQRVNVTNAAVPSHDSAKGIRELCLAQLEQVCIYLRREHKADSIIETICNDLIELAEDPENKFITVWKEIFEIKGLSDHQIALQVPRLRKLVKIGEALSMQERILLKQLMKSNIAEYMMLADVETMDYGAMHVLTELCYNIIKAGVPENRIIDSITIYVGSGNKLDSWNVIYEPELLVLKEAQEEYEHYIHIEWIPLDEFEHEYESFVHKLHGFTDDSKRALVTALYQEKKLESTPQDKVSYTGLANYFTGIIEQEFRILISQHSGESSIKRRMWKEICDYIKVNDIPYISDSGINVYEKMIQIYPIRNKIAHGEFISLEEYRLVKNISLEMQLFDFISWAKIHYEDVEIH